MDKGALIDTARHYWPALVLLLAGLCVFGYGLFSIVFSQQKSQAEATAAQDFPSIQPASHKQQITVDVEGGVTKPGVYQLDSGSRVQDVLIKAGGLASDADRKVIAKTINLAQVLADGVKIYFPRVGDAAPVSGENGGGSVAGASTVNVNTATESDLDALPGIGPVTAGKIIAGRPYQAVEDLLQKKILSQSVFDKVRDQLSVY